MPVHAVIVIPCYNEAARLSRNAIEDLINGNVSLLFVNDGSTDQTLATLASLQKQHPGQITILDLPQNQGKGEAVRQGMRQALHFETPIIGYADADMATPPKEILRLIRTLAEADADVAAAIGSRIRFLGTTIQRHASRHYIGRVFATLASLILGIAVYDTQCGAKVFRSAEPLRQALEKKFHSRWIFDVELIGRLLRQTGGNTSTVDHYLIEVPLREWHDINGSKIRLKDYPAIIRDLILFWWTFRVREKGL